MLADLSDRLATIEGAQVEGELVEAERSAIGIADRLVSSVGHPLQLSLASGERVQGLLADVSATWVRLDTGAHRDIFVAIAAIVSYKGLGRASHAHREVDMRRGWGHILRRCGAQGVRVTMSSGHQEVGGRVVGVGKDYVDVRLDDDAIATFVLYLIERVSVTGLAAD